MQPAIEQVSARVWRLPLPMPEGHWISTSNVYALRDEHDDLHLVDAGWDTAEAWDALSSAVAALGHDLSETRSLTLTHLHQDHRGLGNRIRKASGAEVVMHRADAVAQATPRGPTPAELDEWGVPERLRALLAGVEPPPPIPTHVDRMVEDGDELGIPGHAVTVMHTPGHSPGSVCLAIAEDELIVTGDHVLPDFYPGVGLSPVAAGHDALAEYLDSLARLQFVRGWRGLPGHGGVIEDVGARIDETIAHQLRRGSSARARRRAAPEESVWEIASGLRWGPGWEGLRDWHRVSALRQTAMHLRYRGSCEPSQ